MTVAAVKGPDHTLRARALEEVVTRVLGADDRTLALAEFTLPPARGTSGDEAGVEARAVVTGAALDAARTPPFGTEQRVVVLRSDDAWAAGEVATERLVAYLGDPEPTTALVLELTGTVPAGLAKALKAASAEMLEVGSSKGATAEVLADAARAAGLRLTPDATAAVARRVGEDAGRVPGIVDLLIATFGTDGALSAEDVGPYLGGEGAVPVFELTKALDAGDIPAALAVLGRLLGPMGMHPLQVAAVLHNHVRRLVRLDDPAVTGEDAAKEALGGSVHPYVAKLAWQQARAMGTDGIRRAVELLAEADLDLRGRSGAPPEAVLEILVARLAHLAGRAAPSRPRGRPARRS